MSNFKINFTDFRQQAVFLASGFLSGVLVATGPIFFPNLKLIPFFLFLVLIFIFYLRGTKFRPYILVAVFIFGLGLGWWRGESYYQSWSILDDKVGQKIEIEGILVTTPDERDNSTRLIIKVKEGEKILVSTSPYQDFRYGDLVKVSGRLDQPDNFVTDNGREFDYISYLKVRGLRHEISFAQVEVMESGHGNFILAALFTVKRGFIERLNLVLPEPHASLLAGLLLGERRGLGEELTTAFRRSGLIHIIVLSGYNMTIVAEAIIIILSAVLPFGASLLAGALGIALFAIMVGGGATVVRASLMAVIALFARFTGRIYSATVALFLAGTIMVFINPLVLRFDIGFQLSFIATLGLIYLAPLFEARLTFIPIRFGLRGVLATTTAAQLAVLPWLFYTIGEVSLVALPANLMVIPLIPLTMFLGFGVGLIGFVSYFGSHLISIFVYFLLSFELSVVNFFADLPGAVLAVPTIPLIIILIIYAIMIIFAINYNKRISTSLK